MVKLGIVGNGSMANQHAENFGSIRVVKIVACCDIVKEKAQEFAKTHGIANYYTDFDEMLNAEALDAVSIVVNDKFHAPLTIKTIKKGLHVFCEKPPATTSVDAKKVVRVAQKAGVINMINFF